MSVLRCCGPERMPGGGKPSAQLQRKQVVLYMTSCVVVTRRAVTARPNVTILVVVIVIMLVAAANGWSLADAAELVTAATLASGVPARRIQGDALCRTWTGPVLRSRS